MTKLTAKVTALRTNDRMELTITTSASGLEQCITVDNGGYALDDELVLIVLTNEQAAATYDHLVGNGADPAVLDKVIDQLRPDPPVPFMVVNHENGDPRDNSIENLTTQEFVRP